MAWRNVKGHEAVERLFRVASERGRLAHAYLFTGPAGVGKWRFARELARTLLCEASKRPGPFDPCDQCSACLLVEADTHPDFRAYARGPEKQVLGIDVVRDSLIPELALKPGRGGWKVVVLDDADDISEEAANALLKTLEEPPPQSMLILLGSSAELQLPTIRSRCQSVRFAPLSVSIIEELLTVQGVDDPELRTRAAHLGQGSLGLALALAQPELWAFHETLISELSKPRPDTVGLAKHWIRFIEEAGKDSVDQRRRASLVLRLLIEFFRQELRVAVGAGDDQLSSGLANRLGPERLMDLLQRCFDADQQIDRRVQLVLVLEALVDALGRDGAADRVV